VPGVFEDAQEEVADGGFIVDDEDAAGAQRAGLHARKSTGVNSVLQLRAAASWAVQAGGRRFLL
jgi:hypothetical protein